MKKFFFGLLKALGYFGIYLAAQFLVIFVYMLFIIIPVVSKYVLGNYDLTNPVILNQYLNEVIAHFDAEIEMFRTNKPE